MGREIDTFFQRRHTGVQQAYENMLNITNHYYSWILRQIKTTMKYHFTPVRMSVIKRTTDKKCWQGCGKKGTLMHRWWQCKLMQPLWKTVWRFLKKLKMELPYGPAIPLLGIYLKKIKTLIWKDIYTTMLVATLITVARIRKLPKCPSANEVIKKMWHIYI